MATGYAKYPLELMKLPYAKDSLEPYISAQTVEIHYEKHHRNYVNKLNELVHNKVYQEYSLEELIKKTANDKQSRQVFNNAGQVWNHNFYWNSMKPNGGGRPVGNLAKGIDAQFGNYETFRARFTEMANYHFGSGWVWLIQEKSMSGRDDIILLSVSHTSNAESPMLYNQKALLTIDVWEHAYYLDVQNRRSEYVDKFVDHLLNWEFAEQNFNGKFL